MTTTERFEQVYGPYMTFKDIGCELNTLLVHTPRARVQLPVLHGNGEALTCPTALIAEAIETATNLGRIE